jgi:hypothetical protein
MDGLAVVDLSAILPDLDSDVAVATAGFDGVLLPPSLAWRAALLTRCEECTLAPGGAAERHHCWLGLRLGDNAAELHAGQAWLIAHTNEINEWYRRACKIAQTMNDTHHWAGITSQNWVNNSVYYWFAVVGGGEHYIDLRWDGADENNPNYLPVATLRENGEWVPGENTRWISETRYLKLPARGRLTVHGDSVLASHAPWLIDGNSVGETAVGSGETFRVYLRTPCSGNVTAVPPGASSPPEPIMARLEFYLEGWAEGWPQTRDVFPLWATQETMGWDLPHVSQVFTVDGVCRWHEGNDFWLSGRARRVSDGGWDSLTSELRARMKVDGAATVFDFLGADLAAYDRVEATVWKRDDAAGQLVGMGTCLHDRVDHSGCFGTPVNDKHHYCDAPTCSRYANYIPGACYQPGLASLWAADVPATPFSNGGWEKLTHSVAWMLRQLQAGVPVVTLERKGPPGLMNLCPTYLETPTGWHETHQAYKTGGFEKVGYDKDGLPYPRVGYENMWDDATAGPAGGHINPRYKGAGAENDDGVVNQSQITMGSVDLDPYTLEILGGHGRWQVCGPRRITLALPRLTGSDETGAGALVKYGMWDQYGAVTSDPAAAVYEQLIELIENYDWVNREAAGKVFGGNKFSTRILRAEALGNDIYRLHLLNGIVSASSIDGANQQEITTSWRSAGTRVALPDKYRVNNYDCAVRGARRAATAQIGDAVTFGTGASARLEGRMFQIVDTSALGGDTQDFSLEETKERVGKQIPYEIYELNIGEVVSGIVATRNGGTPLTGDQGYPFPLELAKDVFVWDQVSSDEANVVLFKFSKLNMTEDDADSLMDIVIETDQRTIVFQRNITYSLWESQHLALMPADGDIESAAVTANYIDPMTLEVVNATLSETPIVAGDWWSEYPSPHTYKRVQTGPREWHYFIAPALAGATVRIVAQLDAPWSGTQDEYYAQKIGGPHGPSLPGEYDGDAYSVWGRKSATIDVRDELGLIAAEGTLDGIEIDVGDNLRAHHGGAHAPADYLPVVKLSEPDRAGEDTTLAAGTDYAWHGAEGKIWLKTRAAAGACVVLENVPVAFRSNYPRWQEIQSIRSTIEDLLTHEWADFPSSGTLPDGLAWPPPTLSLRRARRPQPPNESLPTPDYVLEEVTRIQNTNSLAGSWVDFPAPDDYPWITNLQFLAGVARSSVLDTVPLSASNVARAECTITFTGIKKHTRIMHWDGENATVSSEVIDETEFDAGLGLVALKNEGGAWKLVPVGVGGALGAVTGENCTVRMDCTKLVKAYLTNRNDCWGFGLIVTPNDVPIPAEGANLAEAMIALQEATMSVALGYVWHPEIPPAGGWALDGTESASNIRWTTATLDSVVVTWGDGSESIIEASRLLAGADVEAG